MKKMMLFLLACVLLLSLSLAEGVPSKKVEDLIRVTVTLTEQQENQAAPEIELLVAAEGEQPAEDAAHIAEAAAQLTLLAAAEDKAAYFGQVKDAEGNPVDLLKALEADKVTVNEFYPVKAKDVAENTGKALVEMKLPTLYAKDTKVLVLLGWAENAESAVAWIAYPAEALENGEIRVELPAESLLALQQHRCLLAVVSK